MNTTVGRVIKVCIQRIFAIKTMETSPKRIKLDATASGGVGDNEDNKWRSLLDRRFDEKDVGISEFIGHFKPFTAVLKNRYFVMIIDSRMGVHSYVFDLTFL
jgi:hypothetical protein